MIVQTAYPMIMICTLFWFLHIDTSAENFWWMTAYGLISNAIFCGQGYFLGIIFPEEDQVKIMNLLFVMVWVMTNGVLCNLTTASWLIVQLSKVSPSRYNCEGFFRRMVGEIPDYSKYGVPISRDDLLDNLGYTYGDQYCMIALCVWTAIMVTLSIISIELKFRSL